VGVCLEFFFDWAGLKIIWYPQFDSRLLIYSILLILVLSAELFDYCGDVKPKCMAVACGEFCFLPHLDYRSLVRRAAFARERGPVSKFRVMGGMCARICVDILPEGRMFVPTC